MNLQKQKPYRNKKFMAFVHENLKPAPCCVCRNDPWSQLHHFGKGGGKGMKPSDLMIARVCKTCADKYEVKMTAMIRDSRYELLSDFLVDSMACVEAAIKHGGIF
jgi:hypothetical protein